MQNKIKILIVEEGKVIHVRADFGKATLQELSLILPQLEIVKEKVMKEIKKLSNIQESEGGGE